jgi:hypothetical protein
MADLHLGGLVDPATHQRTGDDVRLASEALTTHGVIVGMTGSGKTGLGVVLVEEVLSAGLPALLIDPKGDLTNLALLFPGLAPAEFRPWVDEGQAKAAGSSPDDFAAAQAKAWQEGLAGWGRSAADVAALRAAAEVTIYTPGSEAGVPLNVVGSLRAPVDRGDTEVVADEIEGFVSGLLGLVGVDADPLASREHILLSNLIDQAWRAGRDLDLPALVGMVATPPIRKLGVFDLDQFFPPGDRMALALKLNGLLASPAFAAWSAGPPLDVAAMLQGPDGRPRCAVVTTAHLSDEERQFVTALVLAKAITWMRGQSGTSDLRALLYMDEVAGYLPPTANPPTKKPILTLMKQARAFGLGVVLSTQNPVDVDYKALSNAGTWMIGRLQTDRDKQRLLDGMRAASGSVDLDAVDATISGLAKREFLIRRAGKDRPEVFTTRWAMSYLRGPLTREQLSRLRAERPVDAAAPTVPVEPAGPPAAAEDETTVVPAVAGDVPVRWIDPAAPWLAELGGDPLGTCFEAGVALRVAVRYDEAKADLVHDEEYEALLFPLTDPVDVTRAVAVDHDDRDLRPQPPDGARYRLPGAPVDRAAYFTGMRRALVDHLGRSRRLELPSNPGLKLVARPDETPEAFAARCARVADERADAEVAELRDRFEARATRLRDQLDAAEDRVDVLDEESKGRRNSELLSTAGSILGGLLGGRRSKGDMVGTMLGRAGTALGRRGRTSTAARRVEAGKAKVERLEEQVEELEAELEEQVTAIAERWDAAAGEITTLTVVPERSDISVTELALVWVPVT